MDGEQKDYFFSRYAKWSSKCGISRAGFSSKRILASFGHKKRLCAPSYIISPSSSSRWGAFSCQRERSISPKCIWQQSRDSLWLIMTQTHLRVQAWGCEMTATSPFPSTTNSCMSTSPWQSQQNCWQGEIIRNSRNKRNSVISCIMYSAAIRTRPLSSPFLWHFSRSLPPRFTVLWFCFVFVWMFFRFCFGWGLREKCINYINMNSWFKF